jgi:hypothetical protein
MRPAKSASEEAFIAQWIDTLPNVTSDAFGNRIVSIGVTPSVLWSSHTDTVHRTAGKQRVTYDNGYAFVPPSEKQSTCLGADCCAGVWLMREMILTNVQGLYVFHREEEIGGNGSSYIAKNTPSLLSGIKAAIAFDRKGHEDVITHQGGVRTASKAFAVSLASQLNVGPSDDCFKYKPNDGGTFTDTSNYTDLVGECSNVSVGYENTHSSSEFLDVFHLLALRDALIDLDVSALVIERKPGEVEPDAWDAWEPMFHPAKRKKASFTLVEEKDFSAVSSHTSYTARTMQEFCRLYPDEVADFMEQMGIDVEELYDAYAYLS